MATSGKTESVTRRTALAGLGAGGLSLALAGTAMAQDAIPSSMASHPMVGAWLVAGRLGPSMTIVHPNGTWQDSGLGVEAVPDGVVFLSSAIGTWEPISARGIHFTAVSVRADANAVFVGSFTIDGHPTATEDGQTFSDSDPETTLTLRDAAHNVVQVIRPYEADDGSVPPRTGVRMGVGAPGFPEGTPDAATPAT